MKYLRTLVVGTGCEPTSSCIIPAVATIRRTRKGTVAGTMTLDELVAATLAKDPKAKEELALRLYVALRASFRGQGADLDDLIQNTLEVVFRKLHRFEPQGPNAFERWVYGIAYLESKTKKRDHDRFASLKSKVAAVEQTFERGVSSFIRLVEYADLLERGIEQLSEVQQRAVAAFFDRQLGGTARLDHAAFGRACTKLRAFFENALADPPLLSEQAVPSTPV
jgi:DNA-directed RNA polymerase specialized sigma24 family protein